METSANVIRLQPFLRQTCHPSALHALGVRLFCVFGFAGLSKREHAKALVAASQHAAPSPEPRRDTVLEDQGCCPGASSGQSTQEPLAPNTILLLLRVPMLEAVLLRRSLPLSSWWCHPSATGTPMWCLWRLVPRATASTRQRRLRARQVTDKSVGPHSGPCFSAHLCRAAPMGTLSRPGPRHHA